MKGACEHKGTGEHMAGHPLPGEAGEVLEGM